MNFTDNKRSRWFTVADALIIVIALLLIVGAALLFLMPTLNKGDAETTKVSLQISFSSEQQSGVATIEDNIQIYNNGKEVGTVVRKTPDNRTVYAELNLAFNDGVYYLNGNPLRINGEFVLETKTQSLTGRIVDIRKEG